MPRQFTPYSPDEALVWLDNYFGEQKYEKNTPDDTGSSAVELLP